MVDGKTISSVTVCSLSNSNYFSNEDHQITGGSERQIKYLVDALLSNEIKVQVLLTNSTNHVSNVNENLCIKNLWGAKSNFLYKIFKLSLSLMASNQYIYLRGLSWAHLYIIFISRLLGRKIILSMTSDIQCVKSNSVFINIMRNSSLHLVSTLLSQTNKQKSLLSNNFNVKSTVYYNLISSSYLNKSYKNRNLFGSRSIDALWIGTIEPRKGIPYLIDLAKRFPDKKISIVGNGRIREKDFESDMLNQLKSLNNVSLLGFIQPQMVGDLISSSKVLLNTSPIIDKGVTKEGFPNVFLEAWLFGTPVVSLFHDPDDLLINKGLGHICHNMETFYHSINELSQNEYVWNDISERCETWIKGRDVYFDKVRNELEETLFSND
jgi:glycosyltransferase involved in cell wall biosynthesis